MDIPSSPSRLPRNAALLSSGDSHGGLFSTSPMSLGEDSFQSFSQLNSFKYHRPSLIDEAEVVLDDGSLQKRTVSLSTIPEAMHYENNENNENNEANGWDSQDPATVPLLKSKAPSYSSVHQAFSSSDSSSSDSDSDAPFFPAGRKRHNKHCSKSLHSYHESNRYWRYLKAIYKQFSSYLILIPQHRLVLKCSFAYFLASLFTFVPQLNALIGNNRTSSHIVATATVFFNPAKTLGGMMEAAVYGWGYTAFALLICLGSMVTTDYFVDKDMATLAHVISLLVWLVLPTFIVSFLKAHWNKPPVATASSLFFIILFIIVVREGSANRGDFDTTRIQQITLAVAVGTLITVTCCILFWPISAANKLKKDLEATLGSYCVLLKLLTKTFLLDDDLPEFKANRTLQAAIESHRSSFTALQKSLKEAKLESLWNSEMRGREEEYDRVIKSMQRLAQYVGGLRSSCGLQFEVMSATTGLQSYSRRNKNTSESSWNIRAGYRRRKLENEMRRQKSSMSPLVDEDTTAEDTRSFFNSISVLSDLNSSTRSELFLEEEAGKDNRSLIEFIQTIRQPLKSLAFTCKQTILHLQRNFSTSPVGEKTPSFKTLKDNLTKAISLFEASQKKAVERLHSHRLRQLRADTFQNNFAPGDEVFLVYFFVFNMIEFARELICLTESMEALLDDASKKSIWSLLMFWRVEKGPSVHRRRLSLNGFTPNERNMANTLHTPDPKTKWRKFFISIWMTFSLFKLQKVRYATKAAIAATLLAVPAFLSSTGGWFREYRMEWALVTVMVVMTPTVGGTNLVAVHRIFSTILGCFSAMFLYQLFPGDPVALSFLTWLFSVPNFWLILNHKHGKFGQFTLLAYNLVMLNKYNDRNENTIEVWQLALQRCFAILAGVAGGLIATSYVWPYEARVELRKGLSDFLLRLAWLYQKLVSLYSERPNEHCQQYEAAANALYRVQQLDTNASETQILTAESQRQFATRSFMDLELHLQRSLLDLQELLAQTPNEPRLKGAFPVDTYRTILGSCQNIVDKFLSMRTVVLKDAWYEEVQRNFIMPANQERREMVGNVLLYFYLLASALRLKTPLPPYFPPARQAWKSLLAKLREMPVVKSRQMLEKDNVYMFYYAYVTMMEDIIRELDKLGDNMSQLFGSLVPGDQWERLFETFEAEHA
ncbi:Fusaric acid resistance protein-like-domain-containing protein [Spinellus fusiger]|nr:Fusaric acid resistance protein-like-domain-containing protein [Spinellus fusiger]